MVIAGGEVGRDWWGGEGDCEEGVNREGADVGGVKGGEKCYRGGLRMSIEILWHAGSVMIE